MGVLNVTPDSFSDGGRYLRPAEAIERGLAMASEGADVIDVGGESSRPGATPVDQEEELGRVIPVIEGLSKELLSGRSSAAVGAYPEVRISIDTVKPAVAEAAVEAGATLINDVSATLWEVAARLGVGWVSMHMQGTPPDMQEAPLYGDVVVEVHEFVLDRAQKAKEAGVGEIWVDPGIGFGKTTEHNLRLLNQIGVLVESARSVGPFGVLVGASKKRFLGTFTAPGEGELLGIEDRFEGSLAAAVWAMNQGVGMVRVHDVAPTVMAATLVGEVGALEFDPGCTGTRGPT